MHQLVSLLPLAAFIAACDGERAPSYDLADLCQIRERSTHLVRAHVAGSAGTSRKSFGPASEDDYLELIIDIDTVLRGNLTTPSRIHVFCQAGEGGGQFELGAEGFLFIKDYSDELVLNDAGWFLLKDDVVMNSKLYHQGLPLTKFLASVASNPCVNP